MKKTFEQRIAAMADVLGDIMVYCRSEALKYGLPLEAGAQDQGAAGSARS